MIISDEDDQLKDPPVVVPTIRCPEPAASRPLGPLPDYETSQALAFRDFNESQITLYKPPPRRRFLDSRFWRAALISLVVYIFLSLVIGVPIIIHQESENQQKYSYSALAFTLPWPTKSFGFNPGGTNASSPPQSAIVPVCNNWTEVEYLDSGYGSIVLAITENYISPNGLFSFTSNASSSDDINHVQGAFFAGINPNETVQEAVLSITMQSSSPSVFSRTSVCRTVADNFTDISLYAPNSLTSTDSIQYNITLLFPQSQVPSRVDSFRTSLPLFDQEFGSFDDSVTFGKVTIEGAVSRITVESIRADRILVDTSLEPVTGTFHASTSLLISTVLAPILANISLYNDPGSQFPTILDVHTGQSNLTANVTVLVPNVNPPLRPNFLANLRTFSGSLSTSFLHHPSSSPAAIELNVFNDLGPVDVILDSFFEGLYQVSTKQAFASVTQGSTTMPDPWAPGLERTMVTYSNSSTRSLGWIGWGDVSMPWNGYQQGELSDEAASIFVYSLADLVGHPAYLLRYWSRYITLSWPRPDDPGLLDDFLPSDLLSTCFVLQTPSELRPTGIHSLEVHNLIDRL